MAERPVFKASLTGAAFVHTFPVEFRWFPGMAISQAQKSISALHDEARKRLDAEDVLEISSKSKQPLGVKISAFNLIIFTVKYERKFSVECAYQGSKVFERGGPFVDLLEKSSIEANKDPRLRDRGRLVGYRFCNVKWALEPRTAFYDWLYINALHKQPELASQVLQYRAFSDIAFNPERSVNCQGYSAALYVSLHERGLLDDALRDRESYLDVIRRGSAVPEQPTLLTPESRASMSQTRPDFEDRPVSQGIFHANSGSLDSTIVNGDTVTLKLADVYVIVGRIEAIPPESWRGVVEGFEPGVLVVDYKGYRIGETVTFPARKIFGRSRP